MTFLSHCLCVQNGWFRTLMHCGTVPGEFRWSFERVPGTFPEQYHFILLRFDPSLHIFVNETHCDLWLRSNASFLCVCELVEYMIGLVGVTGGGEGWRAHLSRVCVQAHPRRVCVCMCVCVQTHTSSFSHTCKLADCLFFYKNNACCTCVVVHCFLLSHLTFCMHDYDTGVLDSYKYNTHKFGVLSHLPRINYAQSTCKCITYAHWLCLTTHCWYNVWLSKATHNFWELSMHNQYMHMHHFCTVR
jgi:hypothetical protein